MKLAAPSLLIAVFCSLSSHGLPQEISYFRRDHGVALGNNPLPNNFENDAKLLWRTPLDKGFSIPCVCGKLGGTL